ncbi:MAG: response regulator transcription factor [Treponema sp.]|nr:response regulator transcription factor [Treponema sp.]
MAKKNMMIIEDHPLMLRGLNEYFKKSKKWNVKGIASNLVQAKALLAESSFDLVLLDIQLEDGWGLDIIPSLPQNPLPIIAVYSAFDTYAYVSTALSMGVRAYVTKRSSEDDLEKALLKALKGEVYIDDGARLKLQTVSDIRDLLTKREREILSLVISGLSNLEIAENLSLSRRTIENILSCIYDKTGVRSRLELQKL